MKSYKLNIIQYNCGHSNYKATKGFFDSINPSRITVLAIQEPYINETTKKTYCPKGFELAIEPSVFSKVCFMISKNIPQDKWTVTTYSDFVTMIRIKTDHTTINIINIYNPRSQSREFKIWKYIQEALAQCKDEVLLLGDFNTHHPTWGGDHIKTEHQATHLIHKTQEEGLDLLTPKAVPTWKRGTQESVIDLTFGTHKVKNAILYCGPKDEWAYTKDHIPILINLDFSLTKHAMPRKKFMLEKLKIDEFRNQIKNSAWETTQQPLTTLQQTIQKALKIHCPKTQPSQYARANWSPRAAELLAGQRRARARHTKSGLPQDLLAYKLFQNSLKKEIRKNTRLNWRKAIEEITDAGAKGMRGLWKLSRWSKKSVQDQSTYQIPDLRSSTTDPPESENKKKFKILAKKFFPEPKSANLEDIQEPTHARAPIQITQEVSPDQLQRIIKNLPNRSTPGPDEIQNEVLKVIINDIKEPLSKAVTQILQEGSIPRTLQDSITVVLRKDKKQDYSLPSSYRPIALENTLAKVIEKIVAERLIEAAEANNLLPWNQLGGRKERSSVSAIQLLSSCIHTAWKAKPGCVVSMLSLDLSAAFDNVSHERLIWILRKKGIPEWMTKFIKSFISGRRTRIRLQGDESEWIETKTGIPQGSPLSPVLFLFFISELLEKFQTTQGNKLAFGFIDDTNIIAWSGSARENCRTLERAHEECEKWANRHGARFSPEKYKLIHFTKKRKDNQDDLKSIIKIQGHETKPETALKVLGVWVDPKMTWKIHIQEATKKGLSAYNALARLVSSTWGPSMEKSRVLYQAVVRPAMLHTAPAWEPQIKTNKQKNNKLRSLRNIQNKCLRKVTGGYERTPIVLLEKETAIPPLELYLQERSFQYMSRTKHHPIQKKTATITNEIWTSLTRRRKKLDQKERPKTAYETTGQEASQTIQKARKEWQNNQAKNKRNKNSPRPPDKTLLSRMSIRAWERQWINVAQNKNATAWKNLPRAKLNLIYKGIPKYIATALFLLRTEILGLNNWLASVGVPNITPECQCGWPRQTVRHILLQCKSQEINRAELLRGTNSEILQEILSIPGKARITAKWFAHSGLLSQFNVAKEIALEDVSGYAPLPFQA
jgi:hypothetical protein